MDQSLYDHSFMSVQFPEKIDPWRAARSGQGIEGVLDAGDFTRIPEPGGVLGQVQARLEFSAPGSDRVEIELKLLASMTWICQRCLEPMQWPQRVSSKLLVVEPTKNQVDISGSGESGLLDGNEAITLTRGEFLALKELIEDELLLALPFSPMHEHCEPVAAVNEGQDLTTKDNPFATLPDMLGRNNTK